ncbi:hypothetical protein CTEN210_00612 [Chaetoceros tenuissimus]|uniref:HIT-type domain-containing protein n=1 Tax=Chaetoceros tenuissimus TaxID=426638 RepID=A0AAD3CE19_9STRA|nr:hypothetical protein CTEN210_00612 [Chaetoceros tenuissimus]
MEIKKQIEEIPCQICKEQMSIYRCPACFTRTCSLNCCLKHKEDANCSGKRDRTAFVPMNKFSDSTLASDFHFLEDVLTKSEKGKRLIQDMGAAHGGPKNGGQKRKRNEQISEQKDTSDNDTSRDIHPLSKLLKVNPNDTTIDSNGTNKVSMMSSTIQHSKNKQRLVDMAKDRNIQLLLMPPGMQRHKNNKSTKYDTKKGLIFWKVEFIFHVYTIIEGKEVHSTATIVLDRVPEDQPLMKYFKVEFEKQLYHSAQSETRNIISKFRKSKDLTSLHENVHSLMKKIPSPGCAKYSRIDLHSSLKDILQGMTVIEFPTIDVVLNDNAKRFPLMIQDIA